MVAANVHVCMYVCLSLQEGTAEEVAITSAVYSVWTRTNQSGPWSSITGRHLATPTGIFLSYPPIELSPGLRPQLFSWYVGAAALRSGAIALSPSSDDLVTREPVYTASMAVRADM